MKKLSLILNIVLFVAVGVLFYLHFAGKPVEAKVEAALQQSPKSKAVIAYINSDSLLSNYEFSKEVQEKLKNLEAKYEAEFANRAKGLEKEFANFQQTAGSMSINQARAKEEELMRKRDNLMQYQENLGQRLMQEQAKYNEELYENVSKYLKEFGQKENLEVVLTYTKGSGVLYASDSLDITKAVIAGLNEKHNTQQKPAETKENQEVKKSSTAK